jgi:site-specific recombinase XerD
MTPLRQALQDYLRIRRQLGFKLKTGQRLLENFVEFLERAGAERITIELALMWARQPVDAHPSWWRQRLGVVRGFARYLATIDPDSEVPSVDLLAGHRPRVAPYIYSPAEIRALMAAARALTPALRAATFETLIGLMAATGLRLGETVDLDRADVDLVDGALHVRARQTKQREVPLHHSTTEALGEYTRLRDHHWPKPKTRAFFLSTKGRALTRQAVWGTFPELIRRAGLEGRGERVRPRPHDLRHTFAVRTLLDWHHAGVDIDARLPLLSAYLGHVGPESSYWYLQSVPELLALVARDLDGALGGER